MFVAFPCNELHVHDSGSHVSCPCNNVDVRVQESWVCHRVHVKGFHMHMSSAAILEEKPKNVSLNVRCAASSSGQHFHGVAP